MLYCHVMLPFSCPRPARLIRWCWSQPIRHKQPFLKSINARPQDPGPAPADVLGSTEATGAAGVMGLFGRGGADAKAELWALGERAAILLHLDAAALIPHVLPGRSGKLHIEARPPVYASNSCMIALQVAAQTLGNYCCSIATPRS